MTYSSCVFELQNFLSGENGTDYIQVLPLYKVETNSYLILQILRKSATEILLSVEENLKCDISLIVFGSLGRKEFVFEFSDIDLIIVYQKRSDCRRRPLKNTIRKKILTPLKNKCPWLRMDDSDVFLDKGWGKVNNVDLKYPVYELESIISDNDNRSMQRRWQLILESECIYNQELFDLLVAQILQKETFNSGMYYYHSEIKVDNISFLDLMNVAPQFFEGFDNPEFLYKNAKKYWKTRILREFFAFTNILNFIVGVHYAYKNEILSINQLQSSNVVKIIRSTFFPLELDRIIKNNLELKEHFHNKTHEILDNNSINSPTLLQYGKNYQTEPARLFHGSIVALLGRFVDCWSDLYSSSIQEILKTIPKEKTNFDSRWMREQNNPAIDSLLKKRQSYLKYMKTVSELTTYFANYSALGSPYARPIRKSLSPFTHISL